MPPHEVPVTCPGCGYRLQVPMAAVRRNSFYCPQCGKNIPLGNVQVAPADGNAAPARPRPKRGARTYRRR